MDLTTLWEYQKADMAVENLEQKLKKSAARRQALKLRAYITEQTQYRTNCEEELEALQQNLAGLQSQAEKLAMEAAEKAFAADMDIPVDQLQQKLDALQDVLQRMENVDAQLVAFIAKLEEQAAKLAEIAQKVPAYRKEYNEAKAIFDKEMEAAAPELNELRSRRDACQANVAPELLKRYQTIRQHRIPPMVKLVGDDQCGGCSMQLPSSAIRALKAGQKLVECENCGRILSLT